MIYSFDSLELNALTYQLTRDGKPVHIEPQTFNLLLYLIEHRERPVSRDELFDSVWSGKIVTDGSLSNEIKESRKKLGDDGRSQRIIKTLHGRGYQFVASLQVRDNRLTSKDVEKLDPEKNKYDSIPVPLSEFIGREKDIKEIIRQIDVPENKLISIVGPGGIGKTRFAIQIAQNVQSRFPDGITYISLVSTLSPSDVINQLASSLNVPTSLLTDSESESSMVKVIAKFLGDQKHFIILDNFEHLIMASASIGELCSIVTNVQILVTSRVRLNLSIENTFVLNGMSYQKHQIIDEAEIQGDALDFFCQRIGHERLDDIGPAPNRRLIQEICQKLDGSPLGLEMAASWLRVMSLDELNQEISTNLMNLQSSYQDSADRHSDIETVFESTWLQLTPDLQQAFMNLSLFIGGFTRDIAQKVCNLSIMNLMLLESHCLIKKRRSGRFFIHELLRQFGENKLVISGKKEYFFKKMDLYYCEYARLNLPGVLKCLSFELIEEISYEVANLQYTVKTKIELQQWQDIDLLINLSFETNNNYINNHEFLKLVIPQTKAHLPIESFQTLLFALIKSYSALNNYNQEYLELSNQFIDIAKQRKHLGLEGRGDALKCDHYLMNEPKDDEMARKFGKSSFNKIKKYLDSYEGEETQEIADLYVSLGDESVLTKNLENCKKYYLQVLAIGQRLGDIKFIGFGHWGATIAYMLLKDEGRTVYHSIKCLELYLARKNLLGFAVRLTGLSSVAIFRGDFAEATRIMGRAQGLIEKITRRECPVDYFCEDEDIILLKNELGIRRFHDMWQAGKQEPLEELLHNIHIFMDLIRPTSSSYDELDKKQIPNLKIIKR